MKTILVSGSPKGRSSQSNSAILMSKFICRMKEPCDMLYVTGSNPEALAGEIQKYDTVIFFLPLYIHAMPGQLMALFENLLPAKREGQAMGFVIQAGFIETEQHQYLNAYLPSICKRLGYRHLGTVNKGEAAGIYMFPKLFKKTLSRFEALGECFERDGNFNADLVKELGQPYRLSKGKARLFQLMCDIGINQAGWNKMLKQNGALERRFDRPFLE